MHQSLEPLTCPGLDESRETLVERIGLWIPIVGWVVAAAVHGARVRPFVRHIKTQLRSRPAFPADAWGDDENRGNLALWLCKAVKENMDWPNHHFHPDDPVALAFWSYADALDIRNLLMTIEDEISAKLTDADCESLETMTLGEAVDFFLAKAKFVSPDETRGSASRG